MTVYSALVSSPPRALQGSSLWIPWTLWNNPGPNSNYVRQMVFHYMYNVHHLDLDCCFVKTNGNFTALQQVGKNV